MKVPTPSVIITLGIATPLIVTVATPLTLSNSPVTVIVTVTSVPGSTVWLDTARLVKYLLTVKVTLALLLLKPFNILPLTVLFKLPRLWTLNLTSNEEFPKPIKLSNDQTLLPS